MPLVGISGEWGETFDKVQAFHADAASTAEDIRGEITSVLNSIEASITAPIQVPTWGTLSGGEILRSDWGAAWTAPSAVSVATVSGPAAIAFGTISAPDEMASETAPTWTETLPTEPGDAPEVTQLTVAELAALSLPAFSVTIPTEDIGELVAPFEFVDESYVGRMDTRVQDRLNTVLDGETIIGSATFRAMRDEAASDLAATFAEAMLGAGTVCGMLGELPGEALTSRLEDANTAYLKGLQKVTLTISIEQAKAWREDLWKGVDAAHAYEALWSALHVQELGRRLQAATVVVSAAAAVHNANIARYNALLAQVNAIIAVAGENRARALMVIEDHRERLAHMTADLQASEARIKIWLGEWEGYRTAAGAKTQVFASQVQAFSSAVEQNKALASLSVEGVKISLEKEQAVTQRFAADWQALATQAQAVYQLTQAAAVPADVKIKSESGRLASEAQALALVEQDARLNLESGKAEAALAMDYLKFVEGMRSHNYDAMLNALANMFGGIMAAAQTNMGATATTGFTVTNSGQACPC